MDTYDCVIVGGGPAGLTAAIYLARFTLKTLVIDRGGSRAASIPLTRNHAGFPEGIAGPDLLARMREQAVKYGATVIDGSVEELGRDGEEFIASTSAGAYKAKAVLLATGVVNRRPEMDDAAHDDALARGLIRYCPICDGYEVRDKRVAVLGGGGHGTKEALFLRGYSADITLIEPGGCHALDAECQAKLADAGVRVLDGPVTGIDPGEDRIAVTLPSETLDFDTLYPALGSDIRSELAADLGVQRSEEGCMIVDTHQRTGIVGLYAAGDVVIGLDQISHAMGEGGVAATTIRNDLAERTPLYR